ncbi:uncharacterized protein LOC111798350 isoform X2 [Cucurbita pepo subsp. pepo]|uniref:uncharacterized protein LOC111798350 isoform X2 n=1 Tax=Cucurbita pepo subsp. pepo TaxID=3664 RepID=UPI000C9D78C2|nr:uncharacterized protein LOC111798350 isoform X2 [Cucurbita pepo subsp. pepo]
MPGTIRVSVLEFMDLPELLPLPILIKISMGKRQYETSEKGDFSFPLTTLRDDVILVIHDAGGNEVSRAGVQAKSIVEKGYWDDLFPLEGGGRVHLKFQFALSEDDRSRIRTMRETAMRRKQVERQDRNLNSSGSSLASSFYLNPELSDSQKCLLQVGDLSAKEAAHQSSSASTEDIPDDKPVTEKTNDTRLDQNDADTNEAKPSAIPHVNKPSPIIRSEKKIFRSQGSELSRSPAKDEKKTGSTDRKTPSMVKNVISAFESNLTQDTTPRIKPTLRSTQIGVVEKQTSLKVYQSKEGTTIDRPLARELTHDFKQNEQKRKFIEASDGTKLSEDARQSLKLKGKKNQVGGENLREKDQMNKKHDDIDAKNDGSYKKSMPEKPDYVKDEQFSSKRSGGWIFPDDRRRLCVTTGGGGNQMLEDMVGGRTSYTFSRKVEMKISTEERRTSETRANRGKHDHQEMIKPESSDDVKPSEGPLANAFKIAVMIGFGTLVLLTRQRKKKR